MSKGGETMKRLAMFMAFVTVILMGCVHSKTHLQVTEKRSPKTTLKAFLEIEYTIKDYDCVFSKETIQPQEEIYHYHTLNRFTFNGRKTGEPAYDEKLYLESILVYVTALCQDGTRLHLISDFRPDFGLQYMVILPEESDTAYVRDPNGNFNEAHFKQKIQIHLQNEEGCNM